jgi:hypothetical protein
MNEKRWSFEFISIPSIRKISDQLRFSGSNIPAKNVAQDTTFRELAAKQTYYRPSKHLFKVLSAAIIGRL